MSAPSELLRLRVEHCSYPLVEPLDTQHRQRAELRAGSLGPLSTHC
jgi:hypothetical protein